MKFSIIFLKICDVMNLCYFQRLAETLDADVRRWSSGKEGNLRALLSTLQYVRLCLNFIYKVVSYNNSVLLGLNLVVDFQGIMWCLLPFFSFV